LKKIRFLHIPKTAGTTFTQLLNVIYHDKAKFQFTGDIKSDTKRFDELPDTDKNIDIYSGHAPIYTGVNSIDAVDKITFLRDPVERVKSFCQHVYEGKSDYLKHRFTQEDFDLDAFLNSKILELHNLQTKMLLNTGACAPTIKVLRSDAVDLAFDNLINKISAYGLLEYFDESLILFKSKFKWYIPPYKISNIKNKDALLEFRPRHIDKIKQNNELDIKLYQLAYNRFLKEINTPSFNRNGLKRYQRKLNNQQFKIDKFIDLFEKTMHRIRMR